MMEHICMTVSASKCNHLQQIESRSFQHHVVLSWHTLQPGLNFPLLQACMTCGPSIGIIGKPQCTLQGCKALPLCQSRRSILR